MKLQAKLIAAFGGVAVITLGVSLLGLWQASRLGSALYEVGVVRLPSIEGLNAIRQAKSELDDSVRVLLVPEANAATAAGELDRQRHEWARADAGWALYEPLPQTPEEAATWHAFVPAWKTWKAEYDAFATLVQERARAGAPQSERLEQSSTMLATRSGEVDGLLTKLTAINDAVATVAKQRSVDSYQDLTLVRNVMLFALVISVLTTIGCGIILGRRLGQQADESLRKSEEKFSKVFASAPVGIAVSNIANGELREVNRELLSLLGYSREEMIGRTTVELGVWADPPDRERLIALSRSGGEVHDQELRLRKKGGDILTVRFSAQTIQLDDATMVLAAFVDVTDRRRAEDALRASEQNYRELVDGVRDVIFAVSAHGLITSLNEAFEPITGWTRQEWVGKPFLGLLHPDDAGKSMELLQAVLRDTPRPETSQLRILTRQGKVVVGEFRTNAQQKDGQVVGVFGIMRDITERLSLEEQFHQSQKMEAVGRLAGGVAHDFNNLLTAILGYCELLLTDLKLDDPRRDDIAEIQKAGTSASGLTRQLLAFSRKQIIEPTLLDLNTVVTDMRAMLGRLIGEDVTVVLALRPDLARIQADRGQMDQIVLNLAVNARDAMPKGGTLTLETANVELNEHDAAAHGAAVAPGRYVLLTVSDTGTGMTPEVRARLFEPFFTTKEVGKGTGLGLATVHGIVMRYGGSVSVDSEVGKGTSFRLHFPSTVATEAVAAAAPRTRSHGGTETVLVVEDADGLRELARRLLTRQGYTVLVAANAHEARRLFEQHASIDALLTDVVMPGASGPELTAQLIQQRPALTVIYMSGYTEDAIVQHGVLKPGIFFLNKPFTSETLGQKIREALDRRA